MHGTNVKKKVNFVIGAQNVSLQQWKSNETKVAAEYCWAITQAVQRPS
jgi:DNA-binding transcriptional regulator YdaS (Cro superfamily)